MTCAVVSVLDIGESCTTIETKVNFVRPGTVGRIGAHGTSTCLRFRL
jgi:acyl-coenzyme A thioesterase PaaI-like protein